MARATAAPDKLRGEWFWTDRWMGSSGFLLPMEPRGLYREMLTQAWMRGARLPNDHETIQRACGCTGAEWKRCWPKVQPYWRVDGEHLVNDTQLEVYAKCLAECERASNRGKAGAMARALARAQAAAQATAQVTTQAPAQVMPDGVPEHYPPDPDLDREPKEQGSRRAGARVFAGKRLKVSQAQHRVVLDELGPSAARLDLVALYGEWDAELVATGAPFDVLPFVKARAVAALQRPPSRPKDTPPEVDWFEECQQLHGGECGGRLRHHNRMMTDAEKARLRA